MKFGRSNTATATEQQAPAVDELAPLEQQRAKLDERVRKLDADTAELLSERSRKLLAGDDVTGPIGTASLREERDSLASVIATLDARIAAIKAERAEAARAAAQLVRDEEFAAAVKDVGLARDEMHSVLRGFLFAHWPRSRNAYTIAVAKARQAAARAGQPGWNPGDEWKSVVQGIVAAGIDHNSRADATAF